MDMASPLQAIIEWDHIALETFVCKYQFGDEICVISSQNVRLLSISSFGLPHFTNWKRLVLPGHY